MAADAGGWNFLLSSDIACPALCLQRRAMYVWSAMARPHQVLGYAAEVRKGELPALWPKGA